MRKVILNMVLILAVMLLCSCNSKVNSSSSKEIEIINENLKLKDRVADLENTISTRNKIEQQEKEIEKIVITFFNNINNNNVAEARDMITNWIEITESSVIFRDGRQIQLNQLNTYSLQLISSEWKNRDSCCLSFELIGSNLNKKLNVHLTNIDGQWKLDNFGIHYKA